MDLLACALYSEACAFHLPDNHGRDIRVRRADE